MAGWVVVGVVVAAMVVSALVTVPKTEAEQAIEDEDQMKYLREWREAHEDR